MLDYTTADGAHTVKELLQFMVSGQHRFFFGKIITNDDTYENPSVLADMICGKVLVRPNVRFYYDNETNDIIALGKTNQFLNGLYELLKNDYHLRDCILVPELNGQTLDEESSDDEKIDYSNSALVQGLMCTMQLYKTDDKDVIEYLKKHENMF